MHVASVNVSGTLRLPSGVPAANATVRFTLSNAALLGIIVVVPTNTVATADSEGRFTVALMPNLKFAYYTVTVYRSNGAVLLETVAVIPDNDCRFSEVIQARKATNISASVAALDAMQIAQANIELVRLQVIAESQSSVNKLKTATSAYQTLIEATQNNIVGTVDTAIGNSIDLVTAYQLSK